MNEVVRVECGMWNKGERERKVCGLKDEAISQRERERGKPKPRQNPKGEGQSQKAQTGPGTGAGSRHNPHPVTRPKPWQAWEPGNVSG